MLNQHICQDLLVLILKCLPVKSLLRFRSVCKSWKQLIASKTFILEHLAIQRPCVLAENRESIKLYILHNQHQPTLPSSKTLIFPSEFRILKPDLRVVSSVHGVICLYDRADHIILWNPSIRQFLVIPQCCFGYRFHDCGFWIDPSNNEFKVFLFRLYIGGRKGALFSSRKQAWEEVAMLDIGHDYVSLAKPCSVDGVTHWMTYYLDRASGPSITAPHAILFFDFRKDKLGTIQLPEQIQRTHCRDICSLNVFKWQHFLSILKYWEDTPPVKYDLWAMQNGSWSKMLSFNLIPDFRRVLCLLEGRAMVLGSPMGYPKPAQMMLYDSNGSCCIPLQPFVKYQCLGYVAYDIVESLVFPNRNCV